MHFMQKGQYSTFSSRCTYLQGHGLCPVLMGARGKAALGFSGFGVTPLSPQQFFTVMKILDSHNTGVTSEKVTKVAPNPELFGS